MYLKGILGSQFMLIRLAPKTHGLQTNSPAGLLPRKLKKSSTAAGVRALRPIQRPYCIHLHNIPPTTMRNLHYLATIHLVATATAASLPDSSNALDAFNLLLDRHATGCSHSANWQGGAESSTNRICVNGTSLAVIADASAPPINKTDCQALVQQLSGKAGTGHWDIQWNCDGDAPDVLGASGACGFEIDDVTQSNANT